MRSTRIQHPKPKNRSPMSQMTIVAINLLTLFRKTISRAHGKHCKPETRLFIRVSIFPDTAHSLKKRIEPQVYKQDFFVIILFI